MIRNLKSMKAGNLKLIYLLLLFFTVFTFKSMNAEEKINLNILQPTFEEEQESDEKITSEQSNIKSKKKKLTTLSGESIVKFRALDKITAKTKDINIAIGKKKKFGYLEILPKKCVLSTSDNEKGVVVYIQVKDLSDKRDDKIFVFNGWTFSSSVTLRTFDHPIYDIWVTGCENI